jgi:hypothetical protein
MLRFGKFLGGRIDGLSEFNDRRKEAVFMRRRGKK